MSNSINANRIYNSNYIFDCIKVSSISIYPTQLIFCFLHLEKSTNCSRQNFISGPTLDNIAKDINHISDDLLNSLVCKLIESSSIPKEIYNWINQNSKRQLHFLQNKIPAIIKEVNPLKFKDIKNLSLYRFEGIPEFTNLRIQLELNFHCRGIEEILDTARKYWINTKEYDIVIEKWFSKDKKAIKTKLKATWEYFKSKKSHNENNAPPKEIEDVLIYFDAFCKNQKEKENTLFEIKEIFYAINRSNKREENKSTKREYKQLTGCVPEVVREILNAMADENEILQGELVVQWVIGELRNPIYERISERFKGRLSEIEECDFPRRAKKILYQPPAPVSWLQTMENDMIINQQQNKQSRIKFKSPEETPALYHEKNRGTDAHKEITPDTTASPTEKTMPINKEVINNKNTTEKENIRIKSNAHISEMFKKACEARVSDFSPSEPSNPDQASKND